MARLLFIRAHVLSGLHPMNKLRASDFPALRRVFAAYLHEDFVAEYGSAEAALDAFRHDANEEERRVFTREARRLLDATASLELSDMQALIERLGSRWIPPSRTALISQLGDPREPSDE
jgi:hypothetical protein